jgi:hypothetical protein
MTDEKRRSDGEGADTRRPYEPPAITEVFVDPAKDMLVACAPGKLPSSGGQACNAVQFT